MAGVYTNKMYGAEDLLQGICAYLGNDKEFRFKWTPKSRSDFFEERKNKHDYKSLLENLAVNRSGHFTVFPEIEAAYEDFTSAGYWKLEQQVCHINEKAAGTIICINPAAIKTYFDKELKQKFNASELSALELLAAEFKREFEYKRR